MTIADTRDTDWYLLASAPGVKAIPSGIEVDIINSATKKSILRYSPPTIIMEYEEPLSGKSVDSKKYFDSSDQCVDGWISRIREGLYSIPSVEGIFVSIEDSDVDVWVVIPERDLAILHQIVEKEGELFKILGSGESPAFLMDFHIIYRCGRNVEDLMPTKAIRLPR